jgi:uncharacterized membrane protein HdeD (DUF308 family)
MNIKTKSKMEFSKKIFYIIMSMTIVIIIYSMALMWYTKDSSALAYLIPAVFGLTSVTVGFYYNKAKQENKIKLEKKYGKELVESSESVNQ